MATELKLAPKEHQVADPIRTPGPYPDAVAEIDEKLKADPKNADLWMQRGLALAGGFYMREAVEAYSRAIELDPFKGILYRHRGHRHISCWEFEEAAADFVMASRLIPDNWDVWYDGSDDDTARSPLPSGTAPAGEEGAAPVPSSSSSPSPGPHHGSEHGLCVADGQPFAAADTAAPTGTTPNPDFSREATS